MYTRIKKAVGKRHLVIAVIFFVLAFNIITSIIIGLIRDGLMKKFLVSSVLFLLGCSFLPLLLGIWQLNKYRNIKKLTTVKKLPKYFEWEEVDSILNRIEVELEHPEYESKQMTVTKNFIIGHIGATRKTVIVPADKIAGVYTYHESRRGRNSADFYQVILVDCNVDYIVLQLKNEEQMIDAAVEIRHVCPNAVRGDYRDFQDFQELPYDEKKANIAQIMQMNQTLMI